MAGPMAPKRVPDLAAGGSLAQHRVRLKAQRLAAVRQDDDDRVVQHALALQHPQDVWCRRQRMARPAIGPMRQPEMYCDETRAGHGQFPIQPRDEVRGLGGHVGGAIGMVAREQLAADGRRDQLIEAEGLVDVREAQPVGRK